jgi:hypothetical protein
MIVLTAALLGFCLIKLIIALLEPKIKVVLTAKKYDDIKNFTTQDFEYSNVTIATGRQGEIHQKQIRQNQICQNQILQNYIDSQIKKGIYKKKEDSSITFDNTRNRKILRIVSCVMILIYGTLSGFLINNLINSNSLKAIEHVQNSIKSFFIVESIAGIIGACLGLFIGFTILKSIIKTINKTINGESTQADITSNNQISRQTKNSSKETLPNYDDANRASTPTNKTNKEEQPPKYNPEWFKDFASTAFKAMI